MSLQQLTSIFWRRPQISMLSSRLRPSALIGGAQRQPQQQQQLPSTVFSDMKVAGGSLELSRGKRTKTGGSVQKSRLVNMLSLVGRVKKQPYRLKLSYEDLMRHRTIHRAWMLLQRKNRDERYKELMGQYQRIKMACDQLEKASPELFAHVMDRPRSLRFPLEYKYPTETPPRVAWDYNWKKSTAVQPLSKKK